MHKHRAVAIYMLQKGIQRELDVQVQWLHIYEVHKCTMCARCYSPSGYTTI